MTITDFIKADPEAAPIRDLLLLALSTRGKDKGNLLASAPSPYDKPVAYGVWQSFMSNIAPARCSVFGLMWNKEAREAYDAVDAYVSKHRTVWNALEREMRFNLWYLHHDREAMLVAIEGLLREKRIAAAGGVQ